MPGTTDPTATGTIATVQGKLYDKNGGLVGINEWTRTVLGPDPDLANNNGPVLRSLNSVVYEFGKAEDGYWDDTIAVTLVSKRGLTPGAEFADYDAIVTGGTGRFLGATGKMDVSDSKFENGNLVVTQGIVRFDLFVPRVPAIRP